MPERIAKYIFRSRVSWFEILACLAIIRVTDNFWAAIPLMLCLIVFVTTAQRVLGLNEGANQ
jgi:hypothetical protein